MPLIHLAVSLTLKIISPMSVFAGVSNSYGHLLTCIVTPLSVLRKEILEQGKSGFEVRYVPAVNGEPTKAMLLSLAIGVVFVARSHCVSVDIVANVREAVEPSTEIVLPARLMC